MSVRAKMTCSVVQEKAEGEYYIQLLPVVSGSKENETYYKYTPSGEVRLETVNKDAADQFKQGKDYYVTFEVAE